MIDLIAWLALGALVGWLASLIMRTNAQQGCLLNILVGVVGAFIAGLIFNGGTISQGDFSLAGLLVSLVGAVVLLAVVNLVRRGSVR